MLFQLPGKPFEPCFNSPALLNQLLATVTSVAKAKTRMEENFMLKTSAYYVCIIVKVTQCRRVKWKVAEGVVGRKVD
jgi:hypothetical protein